MGILSWNTSPVPISVGRTSSPAGLQPGWGRFSWQPAWSWCEWQVVIAVRKVNGKRHTHTHTLLAFSSCFGPSASFSVEATRGRLLVGFAPILSPWEQHLCPSEKLRPLSSKSPTRGRTRAAKRVKINLKSAWSRRTEKKTVCQLPESGQQVHLRNRRNLKKQPR